MVFMCAWLSALYIDMTWAAPALTAAVTVAATPTDFDVVTWSSVLYFVGATLLSSFLLLNVYPVAQAKPDPVSSNVWTSDDQATHPEFDDWKESTLVQFQKISTNSQTNIRRLCVEGYEYTDADADLSDRLYSALSTTISGGEAQFILESYRGQPHVGHIVWAAVCDHYNVLFQDERRLAHRDFFNTPNGRDSSSDTWTTRMQKTLIALTAKQGPVDAANVSSFEIISNGFALDADGRTLTPSDISDTLRFQICTALADCKDSPGESDESRAAKVASRKRWTISHLRQRIRQYFLMNPPDHVSDTVSHVSAASNSSDSSAKPSTRSCRYFNNGKVCPYGSKCKFPHVKDAKGSFKKTSKGVVQLSCVKPW